MTDGPLTYLQAHGALAASTNAGSGLVDDLRGDHERLADAERDYRRAKLQAWNRAPDGTAAYRSAWVDSETAGERHARDLAKGSIDATKAALNLQERRAANITFLGRWSQSEKGQYQ